MRSDWVDVTICTTVDSGELLSRLNDGTLAGAWEENGLLHLYWPETRLES